MSKSKLCLAILIWIILGFVVGVGLVGFGFMVTLIFKLFSGWKIFMFTVIGMVVVLAYIIQEIIDEKE